MHPLFLALWIALSCITIQVFDLWPRAGLPWWAYLKPVPIFTAFLVPLMFLVDW